jgi:elongation factor Ts
MTATIELIKQLREETSAGVLACRQALEQNNYQYPAALQELKEKAAINANKNADHPASQGKIEIYSHGNGRIGVIVEVNCETDFTARSSGFQDFVHEIALQIAAAAPQWVRDEDIPADIMQQEMNKIALKCCNEGKPEALIPQITAGYLEKFKNKTILMRQVSIRDDTIPVAQLLAEFAGGVRENIIIRRFVRWELAETTSVE